MYLILTPLPTFLLNRRFKFKPFGWYTSTTPFISFVAKLTIETNNAKDIYSYVYMECGTYYFFYITDDGQLYTFKLWFGSGIQQNGTITMEDLQYNNNLQRVGVRDGDKFVGFLGTGSKFYANGAEVNIIGVLNDKNEEKYYAYFLTFFN